MEKYWPEIAIVLLALALRTIRLGMRLPHFDEGVNGWFVDQMTREGFYHYDPANFHGPLHFYALFLAQTLLGRHIWALRLPVALISTAAVAAALAFRQFVGTRVARTAALLLAISPGMVFYGRDAIHESWQLFFLMLTTLGIGGIFGWFRDGEALETTPGLPPCPTPPPMAGGGWTLYYWAAVMGGTGLILTKETYAIHLTAMGLAFLALAIPLRSSCSAARFFQLPSWRDIPLSTVARAKLLGVALILFFYSGGLLDWPGVAGLWQTFGYWFKTGTGGETGHEKPWHYWLELLAQYEWPALIGLALAPWFLRRSWSASLRYMTFAGLVTLALYSAIKYKTPWCVVSISWPFFFLFAAAAAHAGRRLSRWRYAASLAIIILPTLLMTLWLNFRLYEAEEKEPYVYVQTDPGLRKLLAPLRRLTDENAVNYHLTGHIRIAMEQSHPLPWLLGDFTRVDYLESEPPVPMDADFLLVLDREKEETEGGLTGSYFLEAFLLRQSSDLKATCYLRTEMFSQVFPGRPAEFTGDSGTMEMGDTSKGAAAGEETK